MHHCGWAKVDDVWTCIQDYYAEGFQSATSCGATWDPATGQSAPARVPAVNAKVVKAKREARQATALEPRLCPGCGAWHPPLTTCQGGWAVWDEAPVILTQAAANAAWVLKLPDDERAIAEALADGIVVARRADGSRRLDTSPERLNETHRIKTNRDGYVGETVLARLFGLPDWYPKVWTNFRDGAGTADIADVVEVRQTDYDTGRLFGNERDRPHPDWHFVLMTGKRDGPVSARGWLYGRELLVDDFWDDDMPTPNWYAPQAVLRPMDDLVKLPAVIAGIERERRR